MKKNTYSLEIQLVNTLSTMLNAYEQIYVVKMQKIRQEVLQNRDYMSGVARVFGELKWAYIANLEANAPTKEAKIDPQSLSLLTKSGRSVAVLLTASKKWAGEINRKIFNTFLDHIRAHPEADIMIIGTTGREWFRRARIKKEFEFFDISEDSIDMAHLKPLVDKIVSYQDAMVFYGKFINLVRQLPVSADLRGGEMFKMPEKTSGNSPAKIIFEPTLSELLVFFETQIFGTLYKQAAHESYLAQVGSRINNLRAANDNIQTRMKQLQFVERKFFKDEKNRKQRQSLSGMQLWNN